jgi:uracil-DNA glycosylase
LIGALNQFTTPEASPNEYYNLARQAVIGNSAEDPTVRMFKDIAGTDVRRAQEAITEDSYRPFYAGNNDSLLYQSNNMDLINKLNTTPGSNRTV